MAKKITYEDLRVKPGCATTGFTEWVDNVLESSPGEDYILPISKKLENSSSNARELTSHIESELIKYGEIVKSFYYKPIDKSAYLLKTSDCWHELSFMNFEKYGRNENGQENIYLSLIPDIFIRKPELNRTSEEFILDELFFSSFKKKSYWFSEDYLNRTFRCHLFGERKDKEKVSEILSVIPHYEKFVRNQHNLNRAKSIWNIDEQINEYENNLDKKLQPLRRQKENLYRKLEMRAKEE